MLREGVQRPRRMGCGRDVPSVLDRGEAGILPHPGEKIDVFL